MATKSAAKRVAELALMRMGPAQLSLLPGSGATVIYTGRPGRPKNRKNNATLMEEAQLDVWAEKLLRERVRLGLIDPILEARRRVAAIYKLDENQDPNTIVEREFDKAGKLTQIVTYGDVVLEVSKHFDGLKATEGKNALPFVRQKMAQAIDITEKRTVTIVQRGFVDDGLPPDPAARAKNVTPPKADEEL